MKRPAACRAGAVLAAACLIALCGCQSTTPSPPAPGDDEQRRPVPAYETIRDAYNARVGRLERLQCPVSITATVRDANGEPETSTADGFLVVERPNRVALRIDKAGQSVAYLGANDDWVWTFDLQADPRTAWVTPRADAELGAGGPGVGAGAGGAGGALPLDPRVLVELLGVMPLPEDAEALASPVEWGRDGRTLRVVRVIGAQRLVMELSPRTLAPVEASVANADGTVVGRATYARDRDVAVRGDRISRPRIAEAIVVELPTWGATVRLRLVDPQNPAERLRAQAFDLEALLESYDIKALRSDPPRAPETAPVTKPEANPETKPETKSEAKPVVKPEPKPDANPRPAQSAPRPAEPNAARIGGVP